MYQKKRKLPRILGTIQAENAINLSDAVLSYNLTMQLQYLTLEFY